MDEAGGNRDDDRDHPDESETSSEGPGPRWTAKARTLVLVLQGTAALIDLAGGVAVLLHQW